MNTVQVISVLASIFLFAVVVDFVRRNLLKEKYSVLWLALSVVVIILSLWRGLLDRLAEMVGVSYAPSLLFLVAFIFVILILLHFSVVISILYDKNKVLTQELSLLKERVDNQGKPGGANVSKGGISGDKPAGRGSAGRGGRGGRARNRPASKRGAADSDRAATASPAKARGPKAGPSGSGGAAGSRPASKRSAPAGAGDKKGRNA